MVTDSTSQTDDTTAFLRAARSGNLEKVIEYLDTDLDINTANSNDLNALHLASKDGHVEIVTELLKRGAKVDAATKKGNTALHIASLAGQSEIVNILIQYGAQVNIQSQNGFTPLYMAAQENHDHVVKILLNNGANQSLATEDGFTPLAVAMQQGHDKVVSVLLENDSKGKVRLPALHIAAKKDDCKAADLLLQNDHKPDVTSKSGFTPLHIAAHYGNEEIARLLIKRGADVNYQAKFNISPLHVAAKWGKNNMVKVLLENGAIIDAKTKDGLTPLHCAARSGHEEVVSTLLENSAPISARSKNGLAPLHMASQGDHVDAARVLLYHRAPVDEVTIDYLTSLHVAAHCGHVRVAKLLLDRKADPNARALNGFTPLHIACKKNRIKVVELLLKHGASIESTTESGLTPLHVASFMGCMNIVIFLLQHEANPDVPTVRGETPLHLAARANQTDIIRILLRNGAKVDARAREQQTPLHIASRLGNVDIVMLLLQHGAAVDTTTKDMYTALHIAAKEGQDEVAAILIDNKASIKATTKNGFTPLHIAAKYGNINVTKILMQKESKLDAQGKNNITPLHLACHYDHPNVAQLLLEKGASPQLASQNGHTPLHIAARKNQMDTASILLEHGAKANVESKAGFTPLHLSAQKGHYDMTNLLIEHGADPNHKAKNGLTALHLCAQEDFIRVASILVKNGANIENQTQTGYRPIHVAAHFGNLSMIRFLLKHNAEIDVRTNQMYTPLHQAAQQGHAHVVSALIEGNASHRARTNDGLTALNIAQKLGYISVMEVLKGLSYDGVTPDNKNWEEKYKVIAPESLQETSFMSDSDDEGGSDALISEQPYRYLTADLMKSLRDDSLPIDVTRDDPVHRPVTKEEKQQFVQSNNYCMGENFDSNDNMNLGRLHFRSFLVSFLVDARGGTMKGCRHSGIRIIVPPRRAAMPIRVTCRLVKPNKVVNPPPLMEGEALAARIIEMGPVGASFLGPVLIDIPNFAAIRGKDREIIILRSENGENWKEHDNSLDNDDTLLNTPYDSQMSALHSGRITRIITSNFPQYFAIVTRIKQEVHVIGAEGGILISSVANHVQAVFPPGALTKKIIVGLQAHVIPADLTAKLLGNSVAVSPVVTIEPRRRKFHKPITLTIPVPQAANKGMINQYGGETPSLRLLCSIAGGTSEAQWEDVTGSTPLTFMNDRVSFTTTVSARFWLMDYRNVCEVPRMATELYKESLFVPFITNFVIYSKRFDLIEATLRILCMTDGKDGMHTLEKQEEFMELVKSRDVEALDSKNLYIEFSGNLVPVTKSGVQLKFTFKSFRQNRISFHVKVKDPTLDPVARMLFMREPKVAKGEPPQQPICVLNIVLPETISNSVIKKKLPDFEDSNKISQSMDLLKSKYIPDHKEKCDEPKSTSPSEKKFITDTLQKEQTDAATNHESLTQKATYSLESVDASYPNKVSDQEDESLLEKQTYSEKRKFWEDITRKRDSYQRSESEVSRTSQLTFNESDSEYIPNVASEEDTAAISGRSETMEDMNIPDISECSVAEKAHYFEEQIQKELSAAKIPLKSQESVKEKDKSKPPGKSDQGGLDFKLDKTDLKLELKLEKNYVDQIDQLGQKVELRKPEEKSKEIQEKEVLKEKEIQKEKEAQMEKEVLNEKEIQKEKEAQKEKEVLKEKEIQKEKEAQMEKEVLKEKEIQKEKEAQKEKEVLKEKEIQKEKEAQMEKEILKEKEIQKEKEAQKEKEVLKEKEIQKEKEAQKEKEVQKEKEEQKGTEKIFAKLEKQETSQGTSIEGKKEREESLNKKVQQAEMIAKKEEISEVLRKEVGITKSVEKELIHDFKAESKIPVKMPSQEGKKKQEKLISKTEAESLFKEKIEKESTSIPETSEVKKIEKDVEQRQKSFEEDFPVTQEQEELKTLMETKSIKKQENEFKQIKKEFESRIPVSMSKMEKEKSPEEDKKSIPSKSSTKSEVKSPEAASKFEIEPEKKKEFESRIPKRVQDKEVRKEEVQKDYVRQEQQTREEVTTSKRKSQTQTFSKTFTGHPQDAIKMFEEMSASEIEPTAIVTSRIDHEASTTREKKETKSSEISKGGDKFLMEEEKEHVEKKKISESIVKKQSPDEIIEERESKIKELEQTALHKTSISVTADKQIVDASASQATIQSTETQKSRLFEDKDKIVTEVEGASKLKESNVDVGMKIESDLLHLKEDIVQVRADENFRKEESRTFDAKSIFKDATPSHDPPVTELEARNIAETLVQSIENEIEKRSISSDSLKKELEDAEPIEGEPMESEGSDDQLADDLTRKFEDIMRKSIAKEELESAPSIQEEILEKDYTHDSVSVSEDLTKDEDSYPQDKEGLSSSRFHVTISSSSISDHIDLEDMEANLQEGDLSKSRKQSESDKPPVVFESETKDPTKGQITQQGTVYSEISGARVLEILEPEYETQSRQDSMDISSLEIDDFRSSELKDMKGIKDLEDIKDLEYIQDMEELEDIKDNVPSLHESAAVDSLEKIGQEEDRDITMSPSTVSEETNIDFSLPSELPPMRSYTEGGMMSRKGDSFEIHSPPMISPRSKVKDLEIKPINWMIGDEKIEISEPLQPSQAFDKELEEYQSTIKQQSLTMSQDDEQMEFVPESRMESKELIAKSTKETPVVVKSKFTVTKVSDQDLERELIEDKLEASCQELIDTLERERKAKTPVSDFLDEMSKNERFEVSKHARDENLKPSELKEESSRDAKPLEEHSEQRQEEQPKEPSKPHEKGEVKSKGKEDFSKGRSFAEDHKRVSERGESKPSHDHSALKIKKEDLQSVDLSARYAITVLDQVVKKEIAEVKESLEAAKQDLIEELSENSETVFQIKDSPSEFQFKLQPESIPNELPFLYRAPSSEKGSDQDSTPASGSPIIKPRRRSTLKDQEDDSEATLDKKDVSLKSEETSWDFREEKQTAEIFVEADQSETQDPVHVHRDASLEETHSGSPVPASRSSSEMDNKDDSFSLQPPQPAPRRRQKPARSSKKVISESEPESSGESNYQSCDYEIGSGSRPSSSDFEVLQSALSGTASEYETALMSLQHSSSRPTSQDYQTAASTMSSRESMKSLNSLSSGHLGSIDSTGELSETLVASEPEIDEKDVIDDNLEIALDEDPLIGSEFGLKIVHSDLPSDAISDTTADTLESDVPCRMKRSSEMIFQQMSEEASSAEEKPSEEKIESSMERREQRIEDEIDLMEEKLDQGMDDQLDPKMDEETEPRVDAKEEIKEEITFTDSSTSTKEVKLGVLESVDIMTARVDEDGIQSVSTQVISREASGIVDEFDEQATSFEPDSLDQRLSFTGADDESLEPMQTSQRTWLQQASMSTSSASCLSVETVVEKDLQDRNSPDSDSFELVDKPDIIDDFVVIEEVAREAEEFDSEGKSIRISSMSMATAKNYDRDVENLIADKTDEKEVTKEASRNNELFEFDSEESPPQASNDDQYSQSYSDEEQYEGGKKWIEMQFQSDARLYDIEYERGPLEDIKEEEIADFEGSSRFGSMGSHKESIGSIGSMRGSFGSTPDYDTLIGRKYFTKPTDHDNVSLSSLQEFEHLENAILEGSKKFSSGSQDSGSNGSLPRRYASRSGHGDDVSLSSLKDFEGLEKACKEAHLIELRAREEEDLLDHESPENKFKLESLAKAKADMSAAGSNNQSTSGSDDYEKRIKEIDEIIRIAQANVEKLERQDDTTEDISQIEPEKVGDVIPETDDVQAPQEGNIMETSTDSLELEDNAEKKYNLMCRSSDSLELKTTLDFPSLSSDSLNNVRDPRDLLVDVDRYHGERRISSDSLEIPAHELLESEKQLKLSESNSNRPEESTIEHSSKHTSSKSSTEKTKSKPADGT